MRSLERVIDQMLEVIPADETHLIAQLKNSKYSIDYCPPECIGQIWKRCAISLQDRFCKEVEGRILPPVFIPNSWQEQVFNIWMDK
jgi:hypothetical protein